MPRQSQPNMNDAADKDLHRREGVEPYPAPSRSKTGAQPEPDETTSTAANNHERGEADESGDYVDAAHKMRITVENEGKRDAWKRGLTQGKPS